MNQAEMRRKPRMILFDVGKTLVDYKDVNTRRSAEAISQHILANPGNLSVDALDQWICDQFDAFEEVKSVHFQIPEQQVLKLIFDSLGIRLDLTLEEAERLVWNALGNEDPIDGVAGFLDTLKAEGIRTGVICNNIFSGHLIREMLDRFYPRNTFEFVISSADYGVRKPRPELFRLGIRFSGLKAEDIWYIGDNLQADIAGAKGAGLFPVLYKNRQNHYGELADIPCFDDYTRLAEWIAQLP